MANIVLQATSKTKSFAVFDNLRNLAIEQAGGIGHERIWNWLHDTGLSLEQAAQALGISRQMLIYYRDGEKPIPHAIWLACLGWEAVHPQGAQPAAACSVSPRIRCGPRLRVAQRCGRQSECGELMD